MRNQRSEAPPEASGMWGSIVDEVYRFHRKDKAEQVRLQGIVDYLQDSFASLDDAAVMIDELGNIEWSNTAAKRYLGLRYPEDTGQQLINLMRAPDFIRYFEHRDYSQPIEMNSPQHHATRLQIHISLFGKGSRLLFARDVTHTHRLEQMRKDFIANVSHELRTPLTVINGYIETLLDNSQNVDSIWKRALQQMSIQSRRMENLVKDLILLSRLESLPEKKDQERIELRTMLNMIREEAIAAAKGERSVTIECDDNLSLVGHSDELRSAFTNLVINAVRYTQDGGQIHIRWFADKNNAYFSVQDNGIGIESKHIPRLTERFYRVDSSRSIDTGGTGLGLAIVKHVLLRHQAQLQVTSVPGKGSTFTCIFPLIRTVVRSKSA